MVGQKSRKRTREGASIASPSLLDLNDLFFFLGSFWLFGRNILLVSSPPSSSLALSAKTYP